MTQEQMDAIKTEADGKNCNVFLSGDVCVSGLITDCAGGFIKVNLDGAISYFALSAVQAIQIAA